MLLYRLKTLDIQYATFKKCEEESLCVGLNNGHLVLRGHFLLQLLVKVFVQEAEGITHADGFAQVQGLFVLP